MVQASNTKELTGLRRLDWRFVLPATGAFQHLVLLGGEDELSERILEVGMADRVSRSLPQERVADALIILCDARVAPEQAATCLRSGGVLYCEVDRRRPDALARTPGRLGRALRHAGVTPTGIYWVATSFDDYRRLLPLHSREALRWFFS